MKKKRKPREGSKIIHPWIGNAKIFEYGDKYSLILVATEKEDAPWCIKRVQSRLLVK